MSTKVGGIPEVLPPDLIYLVEPTVEALVKGIDTAIQNEIFGNVVPPEQIHRRISSYYNWFDISQRTEIVYNMVAEERKINIGQQLMNYKNGGVLPYLLVVSLCYIVLQMLEYFVPRKVNIISITSNKVLIMTKKSEIYRGLFLVYRYSQRLSTFRRTQRK